MNLNQYIDHTLLKPEATSQEITKLAEEAKQYEFATVCVNPCRIPDALKVLKETKVGITTVIGFPLGAMTSEAKAFEAQQALEIGATEIDMVLNIGALKDQNYELVLSDIQKVRQATKGHILKVIIETCLLNEAEIVKACELVVEGQADFVKTSTGFNKEGATIANIQLMKKTVGNKIQVKAAGGVRTLDDAEKMIAAGATRLGTSGGVTIVQGLTNKEEY